jgi:Icc-related predicted phosphoesterase
MGADVSLCVGARSKLDEKPEGCVRVVCISDTHNFHDSINLPDGDILIHSGDYSFYGTLDETTKFADWIASLDKFKHKVVIAGNHDIGMDAKSYDKIGDMWKQDPLGASRNNDPADVRALLAERKGITYLENQDVVIEGVKIFGSPVTPLIALGVVQPIPMAFQPTTTDELRACWDLIPDDAQIVVTHGPPRGFCDAAAPYYRIGCELLRDRVLQIRPDAHVFGHVHQARGRMTHDYEDERPGLPKSTLFINASICTMVNVPLYTPEVFDIKPRVKAEAKPTAAPRESKLKAWFHKHVALQ